MEFPSLTPTPEEELMRLFLSRSSWSEVRERIGEIFRQRKSPSLLSILRTDVLIDFAHNWLDTSISNDHGKSPEIPSDLAKNYKRALFKLYYSKALGGDHEALLTLPKLATSIEEFNAFMVLLTGSEQSTPRIAVNFLQYLGTFDPQHIGHRICILSALKTNNIQQSHAVVNTMGDHPTKVSLSATYNKRFSDSEEKLYTTPLFSPTNVTMIDLPGGKGLAQDGLSQMRLIAEFVGDSKVRWLIGSDKFLLDVEKTINRSNEEKALRRFRYPDLEIFVTHRLSNSLEKLTKSINLIQRQYNTNVILVTEEPYGCAPVSSTQIRNLKEQGRFEAARKIEFWEFYE